MPSISRRDRPGPGRVPVWGVALASVAAIALLVVGINSLRNRAATLLADGNSRSAGLGGCGAPGHSCRDLDDEAFARRDGNGDTRGP